MKMPINPVQKNAPEQLRERAFHLHIYKTHVSTVVAHTGKGCIVNH